MGGGKGAEDCLHAQAAAEIFATHLCKSAVIDNCIG